MKLFKRFISSAITMEDKQSKTKDPMVDKDGVTQSLEKKTMKQRKRQRQRK